MWLFLWVSLVVVITALELGIWGTGYIMHAFVTWHISPVEWVQHWTWEDTRVAAVGNIILAGFFTYKMLEE